MPVPPKRIKPNGIRALDRRKFTPKMLADVERRMFDAKRNKALAEGCLRTTDTLMRLLAPSPQGAVAALLSLASCYAIESKAEKEAFMRDCDLVWEDQKKKMELRDKQQAEVNAALAKAMEANGEKPAGAVVDTTSLLVGVDGAPLSVMANNDLAGNMQDTEESVQQELEQAADEQLEATSGEPPPDVS